MDEKKAIELLRKHAGSAEDFKAVLQHSKGVQQLALEIGAKVNRNPLAQVKVDLDFIRIAALLHDIGRFEVPPGPNSGSHGYIGGQILKKEGFDERFIRVCETHVGYWLTEEEVKKFNIPIPHKDYKPETVEEKIISYADKLFGNTRRKKLDEVLERYKNELGPKYAQRIMQLHEEIEHLIGK